MTIKWQKLFINFIFCAISETALNFVGLDTIAGYSEFLLIKKELATTTTEVSLSACYFNPDQ